MAGKPLFAGLSIDDPTPAQIYADHFAREQYQESARAHLQTPATPPERRPIPGRSSYDPPKADVKLITTRSRGEVRPSTGTPSVPTGLRKSAGEKLRPKAKDGRRKTRAAAATRSKGAEKIVYNSRVGMTAGRRMTPEIRAQVELRAAAQTLVNVQARDNAQQESARVAREDARENLRLAIGRERDAKARNDDAAARAARDDIRKFRKAATYKGV
ncbi:hypothetical protein AB0F77_06130 [Streptomyces sp. NPDC026672]|uniref:hypothetical protein n=1 Tax=unclassified Streptomyces TaxID=2593676 RepID=UPI0033E8AABB